MNRFFRAFVGGSIGALACVACVTAGTWQEPAFAAQMYFENNCLTVHEVSISDNGAVHYVATYRESVTREQLKTEVLADASFQLSRARYEELRKLVASFRLSQDVVTHLRPSSRRSTWFEGTRPEEMEQFRLALEQAMPIIWVSTRDPHIGSCPYVESRILLRPDVWRRFNR
jgi:hypothetical protein